ncbi:DUF590-domain-containing protein [Thelephora ganbajun]|uniref:DUF590-domain-containing protein n=1 Tax=Thelephora ganbajun TaxID=370292 RepID=A0ACB6ZKT8_THEGA|nr:DUF590-domain-containing protein [Thelephora ganbajun]
MPPHVDLVILFSVGISSKNKVQVKENIQAAEEQYTRLLDLLRTSGLHAVGKRGEKLGDLMILVECPQQKLDVLARAERDSNFIHGLPVHNLNSIVAGNLTLSNADRVRFVYDYITWTTEDGGLAVVPGTEQWSCVTSIMAIHDQEFNDKWLKAWSTHGVGSVDLDKIKDHFGEEVGLYFHFLATYTKALTIISIIGGGFWLFGASYSPYYSIALILWGTTFVEYWKVFERKMAVRWGTYGAFRVEKLRHDYVKNGRSTLQKDLHRAIHVAASIPVILGFVAVLGGILTTLFAIEAFVTRLYTGPFHQHVGLLNTVLFMATVPNFLGIYRKCAIQLTNLENHKHQSTHNHSLTIKRFVLSAIVAYLGMTLSAFVYVPFGQQIMTYVHAQLDTRPGINETAEAAKEAASMGIWERDIGNVATSIDSARLQNEIHAYTVTSQIVAKFFDICLPYLMRFLGRVQGGVLGGNGKAKGKRVDFEDEGPSGAESGVASGEERKEERELLVKIRKEVALGEEYDIFEDYLEMMTQFGYIVIWSTIWPLVPALSLVNNYVEIRSDAFKVAKHLRRPIPVRTDSIGPWLECLRNLTWIAALLNPALVYMFNPHYAAKVPKTQSILEWAALVALLASHESLFMRWVVRFVIKRVFWRGSEEQIEDRKIKRQVKDICLKTLKGDQVQATEFAEVKDTDDFWKQDEGLDEIQRVSKDA